MFASHLPSILLLAVMPIVWTWPLALHFRDHIPGLPGDNFSFLWNLWWMRKALSAPDLGFFYSHYLFSPFGVDLINHPHTALPGLISATALAPLSVIEAENLSIIVSVFLNAVCAYALVFDIVRERRLALLAAFAFGGSPYIAAHLFGHFDLLTAWVIPLFALFLRRALQSGRPETSIGCGLCVTIAAYSAYSYVVHLALFALAYTVGWWNCAKWKRPPAEMFWRGMQALMIATAVFAVLCLPLILEAFKLAASGRYVSQEYFSAPRGIDLLSPIMGNPFHPLFGGVVSDLYRSLGLDRIEAVGWIGIVPIAVLLIRRGQWLDREEAGRWKVVLIVLAIWALGPFLTLAGLDLGLPLPQALARFVPLVENARMPGRAMVGVYLALGVLMALRVSAAVRLNSANAGETSAGALRRPAVQWALIVLLAFDYLHAPIPLTALQRLAVYQRLASINDSGAVIEVPFGIGDGLSHGIGDQNRRILYYATIHGHPLVGGFIGRMPPGLAQAYETMPIVGNLLRLSNGLEAIEDVGPPALPFRYLVLDTETASTDLIDYIRSSLDMDLIASGDGKELYAVQGAKPPNFRASNPREESRRLREESRRLRNDRGGD